MALTGGAILVPGNELKIWHSFARVEAKKKMDCCSARLSAADCAPSPSRPFRKLTINYEPKRVYLSVHETAPATPPGDLVLFIRLGLIESLPQEPR